MTRDIASQILDLEAEKSVYDDAQKLLRTRFVTESEEDEQKLNILSQISNCIIQVSSSFCFSSSAVSSAALSEKAFSILQELREDLKLAEDILKYTLLCSKYETMIEKATPSSQFLLSIDIPLDKVSFVRYKSVYCYGHSISNSLGKIFNLANLLTGRHWRFNAPNDGQIYYYSLWYFQKFCKFKQMYRLMYRMAVSELETDYMGTLKVRYEKQSEALEEFVKEVLSKFSARPQN